MTALQLRVYHRLSSEIALQALSVVTIFSFVIIGLPSDSHDIAQRVFAASFFWLLLLPIFFIDRKENRLIWRNHHVRH
jgi:hypothetical protein